MTAKATADQIDALLPQTQCTQCGYEGCRPYAEAIASNNEAINRCPPGGQSGVQALATLLQLPEIPLDPECGEPAPLVLAVIDEVHCIGCTLCIQACPVDAIVGANKKMHTVVPDLCTGCKLCLPPCPVDCISLHRQATTGHLHMPMPRDNDTRNGWPVCTRNTPRTSRWQLARSATRLH